MANIFSSSQFSKPKYSKFDLSHEKKFSLKMGKLYPVMISDVLPGDKFKVDTEIFMRMAPMLAPIMHRVNVYTHFFFVPNRLLWNDWEKFITGGPSGQDVPLAPYFLVTDTTAPFLQKGSLADFMGVPPPPPTGITAAVKISTLPFAAYQRVYNEYYRDQNIQTEYVLPKSGGDVGSGNDFQNFVKLQTRAWEKDYFTSALPWSQRGGEVTMPITAEISYADPARLIRTLGGDASDGLLSSSTGNLVDDLNSTLRVENIDSIDNASTTINDLRKAVRLQEWLEKSARGGARYIEQIMSHFGVKSSDARLQRPEYLGGGKSPVTISEVLSTYQSANAGSPDVNPQGNMSGHGYAVGSNHGFNRKFEEHGYIIGIMSVLPKTAYSQGIPRHLTRFDKLEYPWPSFGQLGEQEVKNKELYMDYVGLPSAPEAEFGYQSRYAECKFMPSTIHGDFRDSLEYWHMGRKFASQPLLNSSFITADPTKRIFAVEDADQDELYCQIYHSISAIRPLPYFNNPTL